MSHVEGKHVRLGRNVKFGKRSVVKGESVEIGDGVTIGDGTTINAVHVSIGPGSVIENDCIIGKVTGVMNTFSLGDNCFVGNDSRIATTRFEAGDYVSLHNHLFVNGTKPCLLGHNIWIGQNCILNARDSLTLGNGVGIGAYSSVWTHGAHGELLEGCMVYKVAPVKLEDDVWIVGCYNVVSPGVTIGRRAIVLTGSVVTKDVPADGCVAGNPARDISDKVKTYRQLAIDEKFNMIRRFMDDFVAGKPHSSKTEDGWLIRDGGRSFRIRLLDSYEGGGLVNRTPTIIFTKNFTGRNNSRSTSVFDLRTKAYTKRRTLCEIEVIRSLLYAKARFVPMQE
jgi:maltose O-acetyltransferase